MHTPTVRTRPRDYDLGSKDSRFASNTAGGVRNCPKYCWPVHTGLRWLQFYLLAILQGSFHPLTHRLHAFFRSRLQYIAFVASFEQIIS